MRATEQTLSALICFVLVACGTPAKIADINHPQPEAFADLSEKTYPVQFRKVVVSIDRGSHIGAVQAGLACLSQGNLLWQSGRLAVDPTEFDRIFRDEASKVRLDVVGDPDALFQDPDTWRAEYLLGARITGLKANFCYPYAGFGNTSTSKGEAEIAVEWQIYSRLDRRVVYKARTKGSGKVTQNVAGGGTLAVLNAFGEATRQLLGDLEFRDLLLREGGVAPLPGSGNDVAGRVLDLNLMAPRKQPVDMKAVQSSVVTIYAGDGHGSGFCISGKGHLLTASHVVEGAERVLIRGPKGREVVAKVIATNRRRDVALIRADAAWLAPLPVRAERPALGETVFAVGSPYLSELAATITKGIVSGYRENRGFPLLQSDASINPGNSGGPLIDENGNVVGIAVSGLRSGGGQTGINFFIPITRALEDLRIATVPKS